MARGVVVSKGADKVKGLAKAIPHTVLVLSPEDSPAFDPESFGLCSKGAQPLPRQARSRFLKHVKDTIEEVLRLGGQVVAEVQRTSALAGSKALAAVQSNFGLHEALKDDFQS